MEAIQAELISLLITVIAGCVGFVTKYLVTLLKNKGIIAKLESEKEIANIIVNAIEQIYNEKKGNEKLEIAKKEIVNLANQKGIKINEADLEMLIEASVKEMNKELKK